jgi:Carbohydrate binding domain
MARKFLDAVNLTSELQANASAGTAGQVLTSSGTGAAPTWANASGGVTVSETAPSSPTAGMVWFKSSTAQSFIYFSGTWVETAAQGPQGASGPQGVYNVSATAPVAPSAGTAWFNTVDGRMYVWSGTEWFEPVSGLQGANGTYTIAPTVPSAPSVGQGWLNSATGRLYIWTGTEWMEPTNNQAGATGVSLYGGSTIAAQTAATVGVAVQGFTSQTADLTQWKNSAGATLANVAYDGSASFANYQAAGKNFVINGAMEVWQRGTSGFSANSYTADRWVSDTGNIVSRSTDVPANQGFTYSVKFTGSTSNAPLRQAVELPAAGAQGAFFDGSTWTVSFWVKVSSGTRTAALYVAFTNGGLGAEQRQVFLDTSSKTATTSWQKLTYTFTVPSGASVASSLCLQVTPFIVGTGSSVDVYFTGVQLEAGSVATPFSRAGGTLAGELAACQRYYWRITNGGVLMLGGGGCLTTTIADTSVRFPVTMRSSTISLEYSNLRWWNYGNNTFYEGGTWTVPNSLAESAQLRYTHGSAVFTAGQAGAVLTNGTGYVGFSAEL